MKNWILIVGLITVGTALGAQDVEKPRSMFSMLKVGQAVNLSDHGSAYSLRIFEEDNVPLSHTVIEIGEDFIVVRDIAEVTDSIVPLYSIKAIERVRMQID